jgi:hypothetical protein
MAIMTSEGCRSQEPHRISTLFPLWLRHGLRTTLHFALDATAVAASYRLAYLWRFYSTRWVAQIGRAHV